MSTKKITIVNEELLARDASSDLVRDLHAGRWGVFTGEGIKYSPITDTNIKIETVVLPPSRGPADDRPVSPGGYQALRKQVEVVELVQNLPMDERRTPEDNANWIEQVEGLVDIGVPHYDFATTMITEPVEEEAQNSSTDEGSLKQGATFHYNFFDRDYEDELATITQHYFIPNVYQDVDRLEARTEPGEEPEYALRAPFKRKLIRNRRRPVQSLSTVNQIVPAENGGKFRDYSPDFYPMHAQVVVNTKSVGGRKISLALKDCAAEINITRDIEGVATPGPPSSIARENITLSSTIINADGVRETFSEDVDRIKTVNLALWRDEDAPGWYGSLPVPPEFSFIGPETVSSGQSLFGLPSLLGANVAHLYDRLSEIATEHGRTMQDIMNGVPAYSETVLFKVEKFLGPVSSITTSTPIKTFHFSNAGSIDIEKIEKRIKVVDTQVKYGETYSYVVTAYQAVVGTAYQYSNLAVLEEARPRRATVTTEVETVIKLIEVPLYVSTGAIYDFPPLAPQVEFLPIVGSPRKLKLHFQMSSGFGDEDPIALNAAEQAIFDQMAINQGRTVGGPLTFGSDNAPVAFEIFRVNEPPVSYDDFNRRRIARVSTLSSDGKTTRQASSAAFILNQALNRKFYYMFRTVDYHGGLSNPSPVFEIELLGDTGVSFPVIREYEFGQISPKTETKMARKFVQITPRITQAIVNEEISGLLNPDGTLGNARNNREIVLGVEDEALFGQDASTSHAIRRGKRFKIRFTSKTTGKKVDLNVSFKTKRVRGETE